MSSKWSTGAAGGTTGGDADVFEVGSFNDLQRLGDVYRSQRPVEVSLEDLSPDLVRRVVDFAAGLVYADGGDMAHIDERRYRLVPGSGPKADPAGDREPRKPRPASSADGAVAPTPDEEPSPVSAVSSGNL